MHSHIHLVGVYMLRTAVSASIASPQMSAQAARKYLSSKLAADACADHYPLG